MDPVSIALIAIRGLATLFEAQGDSRQANALRLLAKGIESGQDVNEHMDRVADALEAGQGADWDDVVSRIEQNSNW